jgi:hypothetical protein
LALLGVKRFVEGRVNQGSGDSLGALVCTEENYTRRRIPKSVIHTHYFVERFLNDLNIFYHERIVTRTSKVVGPKWIAPPDGLSKINVDATVSKNSGQGALAAVARSTEGVFLGASVVVVQGISDPEVLEALACQEGLDLASDLLLTKFRVASDCLNVIKSLESAGWGSYGHIEQEIKA